jgi:tetratricopeptide (TPR) repeat protein
MGWEEIERLKERVDKDPNSKLFVPLAEEYKKMGMPDEAIETLSQGIKRHPSYMSAHVALGKIFLDKGLLDKASSEFERVVHTIPDNLYAHKKLAEIYSALNIEEKAIEEFKMVLKLNPLDWDAEKSLAHLGGGVAVQPEAAETFKVKITEGKPSDLALSESFTKEAQETPFGLEEIIETSLEEKLSDTETSASENAEESFLTMYETSETLEKEVTERSHVDLGIADSYISQGNYIDALNIYKGLLSTEPDNVHVLQRIEELKNLLSLLGKGKEDLIAKMNSLLDNIKKRRDKFFSTTQ